MVGISEILGLGGDAGRRLMADGSSDIDNINIVAREALSECRTSLMLAFRFLDVALWHMPFVPASGRLPISTDGINMHFDAIQTVLRYRHSPDELARDYLHALLHCVFRHPFDTDHIDADSWSLACDIVVEAIGADIAGERFPSPDDAARREEAERLRAQFGELTPHKLYRSITAARSNPAIARELGLDESRLWDLQMLFGRDDHLMVIEHGDEGDEADSKDPGEDEADSGNDEDERGQMPDARDGMPDENPQDDEGDEPRTSPDGEEQDDGDGGGGSNGDGNGSEQPDGTGGSSGNATDEPAEPENGSGASSGSGDPDREREMAQDAARALREWEEISRQIEMDLQTYSRERGEAAGDLVENLAMANRKVVDYAEFLKSFSRLVEDVRINDEEFDYIFYTYGLDRYGNMPFVEPLEYKDVQRVREFVIALDTSESCSGELVAKFVRRTYEILKESESFGHEVNVHIVQCDAEVQSDTKLTSVDDIDRYAESFELKGFGGTDFRPVFEYVDRLVRKGEFEHLQGLLYFTDGLGTFPEKRPAYDTAFVFMDGKGALRRVPPWAMKVVVDEERIQRL